MGYDDDLVDEIVKTSIWDNKKKVGLVGLAVLLSVGGCFAINNKAQKTGQESGSGSFSLFDSNSGNLVAMPDGTTGLAADGANLSWKQWGKEFKKGGGTTQEEYFKKNLKKTVNGKKLSIKVERLDPSDKNISLLIIEEEEGLCKGADTQELFSGLAVASGLNMDNFNQIYGRGSKIVGLYQGNGANWFIKFGCPGIVAELWIDYVPLTPQSAAQYTKFINIGPEALLDAVI